MKKTQNKFLAMAIVLAAFTTGAASAEAFTLKLENLTSGKSVFLDDAADFMGANDGVLTYADMGINDKTLDGWKVNMTTGQTSPSIGSAISPYMSLVSVNNSTSATPTSLRITLTDTFGPLTATNFISSAAGLPTANGSLQFMTKYNGVTMNTLGSFSDIFSVESPFQISPSSTSNTFELIALINHPAGTNISSTFGFDMQAAPVPVPPSLMLLGSAVCGLMGLRKRDNDHK